MNTESRYYFWAIVAAFAICGLVGLNIALTTHARADSVVGSANCISFDVLHKKALEGYPDNRLEVLQGPEAAAFMAAWNAVPPVSSVEATEVLMLFHASGRGLVAETVFFKDKCAIYRDLIPAIIADRLLAQART